MAGQEPHDTVHDVFVKQVFQGEPKRVAQRRMAVRNRPSALRREDVRRRATDLSQPECAAREAHDGDVGVRA